MQSIRRSIFLAACLAILPGGVFAQTKWVATWATAPEPLVSGQSGFNPPTPSGAPSNSGLSNNSVRQVLRVSIGGDTLRMRFTNEYSSATTKINGVNIAVSTGAGVIDTNTIRNFKFNGNDSVTLAANAYAWSDPLAFPLTPGMKVEVTIYFGAAPAPGTYPGVTVHRGSRTTPRVLAGNRLRDLNFAGSSNTTQGQGSFVISSIEVRAPQTARAVAILGNSITDGFGTANESFTRWTDVFTTKLLANPRTSKVGVLNGGIGAGNLVSGGVSTPGSQRYKRDLFDHAGVKWVVILLGVNDIGNTNCSMTTSNNAIATYTTIADSAHARGLKVYGATITPFGASTSYYSANSEACRQRINAWVRTTAVATGKYDAVIDFDKVIRDPADTVKILAAYNNDGLHPNIAGYALMGNSIDTNLFIDAGTHVQGAGASRGYALSGIEFSGAKGLNVRFRVPRESRVSLKVRSLQGRQVASVAGKTFLAGEHVVSLGSAGLKGGAYLVTLKAGAFSATRKILIP
jgi:lysophospholipase L1-like esterase